VTRTAPAETPLRRNTPARPSYDWFTEGFDSADLKDAKALLQDLT
jgi:hypothetical protein